MVKPNNTNQQQEQPQTTLPLSYVMWLTFRSKFLDKLCESNPELFNEWKAFEEDSLTQLEVEHLKNQITPEIESEVYNG